MMKLHYTVVPSLTAKLKKIVEEQASKPKEEVREGLRFTTTYLFNVN